VAGLACEREERRRRSGREALARRSSRNKSSSLPHVITASDAADNRCARPLTRLVLGLGLTGLALLGYHTRLARRDPSQPSKRWVSVSRSAMAEADGWGDAEKGGTRDDKARRIRDTKIKNASSKVSQAHTTRVRLHPTRPSSDRNTRGTGR
jgi:hypothetical protein